MWDIAIALILLTRRIGQGSREAGPLSAPLLRRGRIETRAKDPYSALWPALSAAAAAAAAAAGVGESTHPGRCCRSCSNFGGRWSPLSTARWED